MARLNPIPLTRRNQLDQRMTFDSTTPDIDVVARPVDAIERRDVSSKAQALAKSLGLFSQVGENASQLMQQINDKNFEEGQFKALKGEEKPTEGQALIKGYELSQGRLDASKYRAELNQFFLENHEKLSPEEFQAGLDEIAEKYLQEAPSDDYLKGFLPKAQAEEEKLTLAYQEVVAQEFQQEALANIGQTLNDEVLLTLGETLGISSIEEMEEILEDSEAYQQLIGKTEMGVVGEAVRLELSEIQEIAKGMNIDRQVVSNMLVRQIGELAVEYGLPDLMNFTELKDEQGIALNSNPDLVGLIAGYREKAQNRQDRIMDLQDVQDKESERENQKLFVNKVTRQLTELNLLKQEEGVQAAANAAEELWIELGKNEDYQNLPEHQYQAIENNLLKIMSGQEVFRSQSIQPVYEDLLNNARAGELTDEQVLANADNLSQNDYTMFLNFLDSEEEQRQREAQGEQAAALKEQEANQKELNKIRGQHFNDTIDTVIDYVEASFQDVNNDTFRSSMEAYMNPKWREYYIENGFQNPPMELTNKWVNDFLALRDNFTVSLEQIQGSEITTAIPKEDSVELTLAQQEQAAQGDLQPEEEPVGIFGRIGRFFTPKPENLENNLYAAPASEGKEKNTAAENRANNVYTRYLEKANVEVEAQGTGEEEEDPTRKPFGLDRNQVFEQFDILANQGNSIMSIAEEGWQQGAFLTEDEAITYAKAYTIQKVRDEIVRSGKITRTGDFITMLQRDHGFTRSEAIEIIQQAISPVEEDKKEEK